MKKLTPSQFTTLTTLYCFFKNAIFLLDPLGKKRLYRLLLCACVFLNGGSVFGQVEFGEQQVISTEADGARDVYAVDLDGDGDMDVLSANEVSWYENDGHGNFGSQQIIAETWASSVYAADLDGDGDMDVLATLNTSIILFANDGNGIFTSLNSLYIHEYAEIQSVYAADLDGDGDIDIVSAAAGIDRVYWHQNNGSATFSGPIIIASGVVTAWDVHTADLDGDEDMDILSVAHYGHTIYWHENDGNGNFGSKKSIATELNYCTSSYAVDLDGDGDMDVLLASPGEDKVAWCENDGNGNFGDQNIITTEANGAYDVFAADLDADGDMDVLAASTLDDTIAWYENEGIGNFGAQQLITIEVEVEFATSVYATDLDGDGDMDVLSASSGDNKIAWYENLTIIPSTQSTPTLPKQPFTAYPNPTQSTLQLTQHAPLAPTQYTLYNTLGEVLLTGNFQTPSHALSIDSLPKGIYMLHLHKGKQSQVLKIWKE